jgi:G6PDH family F420-dependent oxidoreductase
MAEFGYFLSSEEHGAPALVRIAQQAEEAGFRSAWISDHYHPWLDSQGESAFVWCTIGGIAATTNLRVTTAVTCPTFRIHPAVIAHAAATAATMLDGRFVLGIGSGERLNEHVLGQHWPPTEVRLEMLEEAVDVIRQLWTGEITTRHGPHYTVENARIYSLPNTPPPIMVSGFGPKATDLAARIGDGYINTSPDAELVRRYVDGGGRGPKAAGVKVCWGEDEQQCKKLVHELWRSSGVPGETSQELPMPAHFEQAAELVTEDKIAEKISCGPDPQRHAEALQKYVDAGYDEVYVSQVGPDQEGFFEFFKNELGPLLGVRVES